MKEKHKLTAEVAALAGTIMLESHAESYRVEDTVRRILATTGLSNVDVVTNTTGLYMTLDDDDLETDPITIVRRIHNRGNHLSKIYQVNNISRAVTAGEISIEEAYNRLKIVEDHEYNIYSKGFATTLLVMGFTLLLNGSGIDILLSVIAGIIVSFARLIENSVFVNDILYNMGTTMVTSLVITTISNLIPLPTSSHIIIIAALMPLYPGTAFTNGIRDVLKGDYVSGMTRMTEAFIIAASLAMGVIIGLSIYGWF